MNLKSVNLFAWLPVSFWQIIMLEDLWSRGWGRILETMVMKLWKMRFKKESTRNTGKEVFFLWNDKLDVI